jgi:ring-1,2-phenylacetyl-CoA epoxidase subunit PaaD
MTISVVELAVRAIPDPEIPVITLDDLGMIRGVQVDEPGGEIVVRLTPTYSGCPAMEAIAAEIESVARRHGYTARVETVLSPPWSTDWISTRGRMALRNFGIAPPAEVGHPRTTGPVDVGLAVRQVACPRCGSLDTEELAAFGSTACKALRRCRDCREPFDEFKPL